MWRILFQDTETIVKIGTPTILIKNMLAEDKIHLSPHFSDVQKL